MISAYTLVRTNPNKSVEVLKQVQKMVSVKEAVLLYGEYSLLLSTETKNLEELDSFVYNSLRIVPEIITTTTMVVARI
jgi:DNA-binding Lrp family transcriptional regulator